LIRNFEPAIPYLMADIVKLDCNPSLSIIVFTLPRSSGRSDSIRLRQKPTAQPSAEVAGESADLQAQRDHPYEETKPEAVKDIFNVMLRNDAGWKTKQPLVDIVRQLIQKVAVGPMHGREPARL
jgi:hypothetical protein